MKVLVTGTAGRVGRAVYEKLAGNFQVVGLDRQPGAAVDYLGDLRGQEILASALEGVDVVVHAAALHAPDVGQVPDSEFREINVLATEALMRASIERNIKHFVFTSTTALYGHASTPDKRAGWIDETVTPLPRTIYHVTKIAAERMLERLSGEGGVPVTVIQMSRCFPEPADLMTVYRLTRGVDVRDVASAHERAVACRIPGFRRFIVSGESPFRPDHCRDLYCNAAELISTLVPDLAIEFDRRGWPLPSRLDRVYSAAVAMQDLDWRPRYGFESVLDMLDAQSPEVLPVPVER